MLKKLLASATVFILSTHMAAAADLSAMPWEKIVAQAKQEGKVTWNVWYLQDDLRRVVKAFESEYGIAVTIPDGTIDGNAEKLMAQKGRDKGDIDVFAWDFGTFETVNTASLFQPLSALPVDDGRVTKLSGYDAGKYVVAFWGNQTGIAYDPAKVDEARLPQTPNDFAAFWKANPGKFGFNYEKGGAGPSFYQNILRVVSGVDFKNGSDDPKRLAALKPGFDFFNKEAENYVVTASNADSITRISDGELWMAPAWEDHLAGLKRRGEVRKAIKFYIPAMGMNGGGNGVAIPLNAPRPAAALVFVNWLTSPKSQAMLNREFGTVPMHAAADDSAALVPREQRQYRMDWGGMPFRKAVENTFVEKVIQQR